MRKVIRVSALLLALTYTAYAGDMPNGTPQHPGPGNIALEPTGGESFVDETTTGVPPSDANDSLAQMMMELLAFLPSII